MPHRVEKQGRQRRILLKHWEDPMSGVPRTEKTVVGADLNGHVGKIQVVFKVEETAIAKGTERGDNLGKHGEPRLGTSKHFYQHKGRVCDHQ